MSDCSASPLARSIAPEHYRHFTSSVYDVIAVGRLSEERAQEMVVHWFFEHGWIWIRPLEMFVEIVDRPGDQYRGPRFVHLKEEA